jgi:signal transduction histidine kinase
MSTEPDSLILRMLRDMRAEIGEVRSEMATKGSVADLRSEISSLRADVAADVATIRKEVSEQVAGLRRAVVEYHSSVIGHGVLISELEARVRRVEQHLNLPALDQH